MQTTERECLDALRTAAEELGESPTKKQYERLGLTPAASTILRVVGGWNDAKEKAGLETNPSTGSRTQPKPEDVEVSVDSEWEELSQDQRWYYRNREADNEYELDRRRRLRAWIYEYKSNSDGCTHCDVTDPKCLDFHHPDEDDKEMAVNEMVTYGYAKADIRAEIEQCVLLCANCHHREHSTVSMTTTALLDTPPTKRERLQRWSVTYRHTRGCQQCPETHPACLQFHHTDEEAKRASIAAMIADSCSLSEIRAEAEKCIVLCANCHRKEHYDVPTAPER